ncbi:MAG: sulfatase-like hydrolase/transferase [Bacteroidetes bacterium]|nr:sulfatase-like hydrolase/transferase [Bacteroidota bacterium]
MKTKLKFLFVPLLFAGLSGSAQNTEKPNVIVILTDDQGSIDMNCYGAEDLVTPNMDKIVTSGVKFTQFYASPVCSPTRACLLTGRTPQRAGVPELVKAGVPEGGMPNEQYTMAEMFQDAGYATAHIGKWHLGQSEDQQPNAQGFDYSFGFLVGCIDNYSHFGGQYKNDLHLNGRLIYRPGEYFPDMMLDHAKSFIDSNKDHPFFIYYALNVPHYPYQGDKKWLDYYNKKGVPYPRNLYAAFLSTMDDNIDGLLAKLEESGLRENTIIIFQSDNGYSTEKAALGGGGSSCPYKGNKFSLFEGGIRVPAAISWPKGIKAAQVRNQMAFTADWLPTLADLCGIDLSVDDIDGKSLIPIIIDENKETLHDTFCWQFHQQKAVRKGDWKLVINPVIIDLNYRNILKSNAPYYFLVNLKDDIGETTNIAEKYPEKTKELEAIFNKWKIKNP